ncbi:hypothetical protein [Sporosarcina sp. BI001-red]|uniref:hypothetical protein n=1 Tax=Sporosarcina sp. BI001-red TaxID=2282866 RepID=UPI001314954D|nr:hypothetical protein [Sporosarcina sp. BI001-red]
MWSRYQNFTNFTYLNAEALAWWYQDDGHLKVEDGIMRKVVLSTDSFTINENLWLIQLLKNKFNLHFSFDSQNRLLLYDQAQIIQFLNIVTPYVQPCMNRKAYRLPPIKPIATRTTIYLPQQILLRQPTREINKQLAALSCFHNHEDSFAIKDSDLVAIITNRKNKQPTKSYQISIQEEYKVALARLRQQAGLTISELVAYCFKSNHVES